MLAEWTRLELATPGVTGRYSNQLNYHSSRNQNIYSKFLTYRYLEGLTTKPKTLSKLDNIEVGGVDETRTRDPRRDRPVF